MTVAVRVHRYTLRSRGSLNAVSKRREFHGALIQVGEGVGCLHPWPEFGDAPVEEQLRLLREGGTSKVIERALRMAEVDGAARRQGVSLFADLEIPPSHYSWDQNQPDEPQVRRVMEEGWRAVKTKGARDWTQTARWIRQRIADFGPARSEDGPRSGPRLRVDFNGCLTEEAFRNFLDALSGVERASLDFIEDPFPFDAEAWARVRNEGGVALACDKGLGLPASADEGRTGFDFAVLKPGRRDWRSAVERLAREVRVVMTSAMDHAIGQSFAAWEAATAWRELGARLDLCGFCTEHLFESDPFFERLRSRGGRLEVDRGGTGLGFDAVLHGLDWEPL